MCIKGNAVRYYVKAVGELDPRNVVLQDEEHDSLNISQSEDDQTLSDIDTKSFESEIKEEKTALPYNNWTSDEWFLNCYDVEAIAIGAGILGCGGGGSPYLAKIRAKQQLRNGKKLRIIKQNK